MLLEKEPAPKIGMLCFVVINSVTFCLTLCVYLDLSLVKELADDGLAMKATCRDGHAETRALSSANRQILCVNSVQFKV